MFGAGFTRHEKGRERPRPAGSTPGAFTPRRLRPPRLQQLLFRGRQHSAWRSRSPRLFGRHF